MVLVGCSQTIECDDPTLTLSNGSFKIDVCSMSTEVNFPEEIVFDISVESSEDIETVHLRLLEQNSECDPGYIYTQPRYSTGKSIRAEYSQPYRNRDPIIPGKTLEYYWVFGTSAGNEIRTPTQILTIEDDSQVWSTDTRGMVNLHRYAGTQDFADFLLDVASYQVFEFEDVFGQELDKPIDIYIYDNVADLQASLFDAQEWVAGMALPAESTIVLAISPDEREWGEIALAHEITHLFVGKISFNCVSFVPGWLDEGLATYIDGNPPLSKKEFQDLAAEGTLYSMGVLNYEFSENPDYADLAYTQSFYMVEFLLDEFGPEKLFQLLSRFSDSTVFQTAFRETYGITIEQFEELWLRNLG